MNELPQERLVLAVKDQALAEAAFEDCREWCNDRVAFGEPLIEKQVVGHKLANMKTKICANSSFVQDCLELHSIGQLDGSTASMAKVASSELAWFVCDEAVQLHGGAGYMWETAAARRLAEARVSRVWGGSNEILYELISRGCRTKTRS
mmetsp:Transcript_12264/g.40890  ORF Transcript_12264/g.40890 Transcript_12264/m.40890 type:complete len:149 (-) Transcript_12264:50-496(-)